MLQRIEPKFGILPEAQKQIWASLAAAPQLDLILYGGTAVALHLGHRTSVDFDFFRTEPLDKEEIRSSFPFAAGAAILQDRPNTLVVSAAMPSGRVKVSFFGGLRIGRVNDPVRTTDSMLLVASLDDLMATKLKTTLDRAEAKDYQDIAAMISAGASLPIGLSAFKQMFQREPAEVLRAIGFFGDGDLRNLSARERKILCDARDQVGVLPTVRLRPGLSPAEE
ncbi:nucleotidyl transferase AbiEii/AbiGii toxin family protein [Bradyrhizobium sp.]|uniref:nucleotidyl transferase AbiEii/AbiGii toxin family protein n=1 Tax=Bradyrhizobium sp. TaxID=376 RepID=UPI001DA6A9FE|nr:nucleotidyl transferase AbiEii/AbiGii toxin family protein [Bradyrhizobium sp.]MBI5321650.1 nucleotidyl transferase AbiEii/AbiGii toxin family protein [Bradyrhizobium sp.]